VPGKLTGILPRIKLGQNVTGWFGLTKTRPKNIHALAEPLWDISNVLRQVTRSFVRR
jgi:hypothetical protein